VRNIRPAFSPDEFKAQQRQMWDNAAAGWQDWWETIERAAQKVSDKIVQLAEIQPGDRVLDIATGIGRAGGYCSKESQAKWKSSCY
jgi:cyclopropane fatty-acyl-phospholipid synthase-like methyltransferase